MDSATWINEITIENPDVPKADDWADFREWTGRDHAGNGVLPPIRRNTRQEEDSQDRRSAGITVERNIEPTLRTIRDLGGSGGRLEVVHFNQPIIKLEVDEPAPEKVPRIEKFHPLPILTRNEKIDRQVQREVTAEWGKAKKHQVKWMVGAAAGVVSIVILSMILLPLLQPTETARTHIVYTTENEQALPEDTEAQIDMLRRQDEAVRVFRRFASAATHADLLMTVRLRDEVSPLVKLGPVRALVPPRWAPSQDCEWQSYGEQGRVCGILTGVLPDFSQFTAFMTLEHDVLLVDWKATTGYGSASFEELAQGRGDSSEIRGFLKPTDFYTAAFPEQEFRSYVLLAPDREHSVWVYTRRDGPAEAKLSTSFAGGEIVAPDTDPQRFTVALFRPRDREIAANQWIVKEVLHKQWIRP